MPDSMFRKARKELGWSVNEMADKMGVSPSTVRNWELGNFPLSQDKLILMAEVTGFSVPYLLGLKNDQVSWAQPLDDAAFPIMHGNPVWSKEHGWGLVNLVDKMVILPDGKRIAWEELAGKAFGLPPALSLPIYGFGRPLQRSQIVTLEKVWVEPISDDTRLRNELRGWYHPVRDVRVENEFGNRFYLDTYGAKWLAFTEFLLHAAE